MKQAFFTRRSRRSGFTLLELVIVLSIMSIVIAASAPIYQVVMLRAREAVLRDNLFKMRDAISRYTYDKNKAPGTLKDLETAKYFREIPIDPMTGSNDTWIVKLEEEAAVPTAEPGILDVASGAEGNSSEGTAYSEW
jgi:general secretion pathway protein G